MTPTLEVAAVVEATEAEGPHRRCAIWVQGCSLRCPGCCNPEMFDRNRGRRIPVPDLIDVLQGATDDLEIEGITVLGGEPLEQLPAVAALAHGARSLGLGVLVFTGLPLQQAQRVPGFSQLWRSVDTLVDGPFAQHRPDVRRRFVGSENQRIRHRTLRYADPDLWHGPEQAAVEIAADGSLKMTGYPVPVERLVRALEPW